MQDRRVLHRVVELVKGDLARYGLELQGLHRILRLRRVIHSRVRNRLAQHVPCIVAQRCERIRYRAELGLVPLHKVLHDRTRVVRRVVVAVIPTICRLAVEVRRVPTISTQQHCGDALLLRLQGDQVHLLVVGRDEEHVWIGTLDLGQDGGEVRVFLHKGLPHGHLPTACLKGSLEELGQSLDIVIAYIQHHCRRLRPQVLQGELGHHRPLERVNEASAEDVRLCVPILVHRYLRVRRRRAQLQYALFVRVLADRDGRTRAHRTKDVLDLVFVDRLLARIRGCLRVTLRVTQHPLDRTA